MSPKEKYEIIVAKIEELIKSPEDLNDKELIETAFNAASEYMDDRSKNTIFSFLLKTTVIKYISERRLMASYKVLLTEKGKDAYKKAFILSGTGSAQAFATKFKECFGFPPTDAIKLNDDSLYKAVPTWESLSNEDIKEENMTNKKFGISIEQFRVIQEALNLEDFYDLNDMESDFAFTMYSDEKAPLEDSFQFVGSYLMQNDEPDRDARLLIDLGNEDVQYLFFRLGLDFDEIFNVLLMQFLGEFKESVQSYSEEFVRGCAAYPIEANWTEDRKEVFEDIYHFYKATVDSNYTMYDFCMFVYLLDFMTKEQAIKKLKPGIKDEKGLNKAKNSFEDSLYDAFCEDEIDISYEDKDRYEPEVWDANYSVPPRNEDIDYDEYDEDAWIAKEIEAKDPEQLEDFDEDIYFDTKEFIAICESMSELSPEQIDEQKKKKRAFIFHKNLDVKTYWENRGTGDSTSDLLFI